MKFSKEVLKDLDRVIELSNALDLETIRLQKKACDLINQGKFSELNSEFKWEATVSQLISSIKVLTDSEDAVKVAVKEAGIEYAKTISNLVGDLDDTLDTKELYAISRQYESSEFEAEALSYVESKVSYTNVTTPRDVVMDIPHLITHDEGVAEPLQIPMEFKSALLEQWITDHTLVQDGHLVFVE